MDSIHDNNENQPCWFVGARVSHVDRTAEFIRESRWETNTKDERMLNLVKSIEAGDRIAIKSAYVRKDTRNLPFDNLGRPVSVMGIKATGIVQDNLGDGQGLKVAWKEEAKREWYFYTNRRLVWKVTPEDWATSGLIDFTFNGKEQDIKRFLEEPYWHKKYSESNPYFLWTNFYEALADSLLDYKNDRDELLKGLYDIAETVGGMSYLYAGSGEEKKYLEDIDPYTVLGSFNRGITNDRRKKIAAKLAEFLQVDIPVPEGVGGIPVFNNMNSWLFGHGDQSEQIDALWRVFEESIYLADSGQADHRDAFMNAFDDAIRRPLVAWKLTMGLYWSRPWYYPTLDRWSRQYIEESLQLKISYNGPQKRCSAADYMEIRETLVNKFNENDDSPNSFPDVSLAAWEDESQGPGISVGTDPDPYSLKNVLADGCFIEQAKLDKILKRLKSKKNLILQGPPGTGKTWLAKRLAYALIGKKNDQNIAQIQFHPNLSYEDFVRGYRPSIDGKLELINGPFIEMAERARMKKEKYVVVIEEINRGNPAQIFGEMLTLLEADKRCVEEALKLSYSYSESELFYIPDNLYVIGTMNIADRSLALVDLALRRRFAFFDLEPMLNLRWREWNTKFGIGNNDCSEIQNRIDALNKKISEDGNLGSQFQIGHSYVTPSFKIENVQEWFREVVETEIGPMLEEYWFDDSTEAKKAKKDLLKEF